MKTLTEYECDHEEAYIEPACCRTTGEGGLYWCGCQGQDSVICPNPECTGIEDWEVDNIFNRLQGVEE